MSQWAPKRFWKTTDVRCAGAAWHVVLDERVVQTPAKQPLALPSEQIARAIAHEWDAQEGTIDQTAMPFTQMANSAIDKIAPQHADVVSAIAKYGETDLLCYRAEAPAALVARQETLWDPLLTWADETYGAQLVTYHGVMPGPQSPQALERLAEPLARASTFELAALYDLVSLSGSLIIGLAAVSGAFGGENLWDASRVDETFQAESWGCDDEATEVAERKRRDFLRAIRFYNLVSERTGA